MSFFRNFVFLCVIGVLSVNAHAKESISIKDFGAVPNDNKDDLAAIQKCIDSAAKRGVACYMPAGKYNLSGDLWLGSNSEVYGEGNKTELVFANGMIRALKNGSSNFYYTGHYNNEIVPGKFSKTVLVENAEKGNRVVQIHSSTDFSTGDWVYVYNNRKDTWTILEKLVKGKNTPAYLNGSKDVLVKGQVAKIIKIDGNKVTLDREIDSLYPAKSTFGKLTGSRNIYIHDFSIKNHNSAKRAYAILFEQPFNVRFERLKIEAKGGGICLLHYAFRCLIKDCDITNSANYSVKISNFCSENQVLNNNIKFVTGGDCSVLVMMYSKKNTIEGNKINCLSKLKNYEGGVFVHATSFENRVIRNTVTGGTACIGAYYGANNNIFRDNKGFKCNTGITAWYAGTRNTFENNKLFFSDNQRDNNKKVGFYTHCSGELELLDNTFSGKMDIGALLSPKKGSKLTRKKHQQYLVVWTGLGFKSNLMMNKNTFRSSKTNFKEFLFE